MMISKLLQDTGFWNKSGNHSEIIISSRIRLLRNHANYTFPISEDYKQSETINEIAAEFCQDNKLYSLYKIIDLTNEDCKLLKERSLISHSMENNKRSSFINNNKNDYLQILVNDEEHFKIQASAPGLNFKELYKQVNKLDDQLNHLVPYAFSSKYGYLTSSIESVGTGLKASAIMHLPALTCLKSIKDATRVVDEMGGILSPIYGNKSKNFGSLYIISNKFTIGKSEDQIISDLENILSLIVELETEAREDYLYDNNSKAEDQIWRSYGLLKYARNISYFEAIEYLSNIRLGVVLSFFKNYNVFDINDMMITIQDGHLSKYFKKVFNNIDECDDYRANYLRKQFK